MKLSLFRLFLINFMVYFAAFSIVILFFYLIGGPALGWLYSGHLEVDPPEKLLRFILASIPASIFVAMGEVFKHWLAIRSETTGSDQ